MIIGDNPLEAVAYLHDSIKQAHRESFLSHLKTIGFTAISWDVLSQNDPEIEDALHADISWGDVKYDESQRFPVHIFGSEQLSLEWSGIHWGVLEQYSKQCGPNVSSTNFVIGDIDHPAKLLNARIHSGEKNADILIHMLPDMPPTAAYCEDINYIVKKHSEKGIYVSADSPQLLDEIEMLFGREATEQLSGEACIALAGALLAARKSVIPTEP